jgi:hypothetical protein
MHEGASNILWVVKFIDVVFVVTRSLFKERFVDLDLDGIIVK